MQFPRTVILLVVMFSFAADALGGADQSPLRIVRGRVLDAHNLPLPSAIVYLQNLRIQRIRTCITDKQSRYHFAGLVPFDDYTVRASYQRKHAHFLISIPNLPPSSI
jgi:protocatechuate 3,4-dioxygenase beta subunit